MKPGRRATESCTTGLGKKAGMEDDVKNKTEDAKNKKRGATCKSLELIRVAMIEAVDILISLSGAKLMKEELLEGSVVWHRINTDWPSSTFHRPSVSQAITN